MERNVLHSLIYTNFENAFALLVFMSLSFTLKITDITNARNL